MININGGKIKWDKGIEKIGQVPYCKEMSEVTCEHRQGRPPAMWVCEGRACRRMEQSEQSPEAGAPGAWQGWIVVGSEGCKRRSKGR